ncbi:MAG TPA: tetratricopeptide repeat protein [Terriglobales bacterium]|nr:tetratricopeptide repeat protein [Terriglobales bacterium]
MNDQIVSHYRILEKLGAGGMGVVYKAEDTRLGRMVALKFLPDTATRDPRALERFKREARTASALDHPNICTIYEIDEDRGQPFIAMQFLEGQTLRERIGDQPVPLGTLLDWALQITDALQAAHAKGIMHRDIKPANVFITGRGQAKILDFGLAKLTAPDLSSSSDPTLSSTGPLTHTGAAIGTVAYMSPEQARGEALDARTDLFSFGVLLYEMASGRQAFSGPTWAVTVHAILGQAPVSLNESMPGLPHRLQEIIDKSLVKNRDLRYQSAAEIHHDLLRLKKDYESGKKLKSTQAAATWTPKRKMQIAAAGTLAILLAAGIIWGPRLLRRMASKVAGSAAPTASLVPERKSIAVLPMAASGDPKLTAFGKGLLEDVAAKLSQLSANHDLEVVPARTLADKNVLTLSDAKKEFGVSLGLAVSLEQSNDLVRASYSLTDARSGRNLAGDSITAPVSDLFSIEDQLTNGVAAALNFPLRSEEKQALGAHSTTFPEAYQYYVQGRGYLQDPRRPENLTSAEIVFKQALKIDPNYGQAEAALGQTYWLRYQMGGKQKQWITPAQQACDKAVDLGNAGAEGHLCLGLLEDGTGRYEKAAEQFQQAVELDPTNDRAYTSLATVYQHLNQPDKAEETYKRAITVRPQYWRVYNMLGVYYLTQADYEKAAATFERATKLDPDSYLALNNLGAALLYEGKDDEAAQAFAKSVGIRPTRDAYNNMAVAQFRLHRFRDSVGNYKEALKLDDSDYQTWGNMGDSYYYGGDLASASSTYRKAISLAEQQLKVNPRDPGVLGDLASYHSMLGERQQALNYLDRSLELGHGDKELLLNAAVVYNQLHETGPALEWLSKALAAGYSRSVVATGAPFDNLHDNPRYQALMHQK